jgi:hypothetical protein
VGDHPAGGLSGIVPAFEGSDDDWRIELADTVELDLAPPLPRRLPGDAGSSLRAPLWSLVILPVPARHGTYGGRRLNWEPYEGE